jgi:translation initiation factor 5
MLNIPSYIEDPSYRYQMPALITKVEGRGNGIRTKLLNLTEVAKFLRVPAEYPLRFFGGEFCTQTENKREKNGDLKIMINGNFTSTQLQQVLDRFIEKFVLCPRCHYPEIDIVVKKNGTLFSDCVACGANCQLDLTHRLSSYIVKHPPPITREQIAKREGNDKRQEEAKKSRTKKTSHRDTENELTINSPEVLESIQALTEIAQTNSEELSNAVRGLSLAKGLEPSMRLYVVLSGIFDINLVQKLKERKLVKLLRDQSEGLEEGVLLALSVVYVPKPDMHKFLPTAFKYLFDGGVFTEKFLVNWHKGLHDFHVKNPLYNPEQLGLLKTILAPFLNWLEEAEEEEVEEEEEEDMSEQAQIAAKQRALIAEQLAALAQRPQDVERALAVEQPSIDLMSAQDDEVDIDDI